MPHYDVRQVKNRIMRITYLLIWLKCFFFKRRLGGYCGVLQWKRMDWYS